MARSYARHEQIVVAVVSCGGGDENVRESSAFHLNAQKRCFTCCDDDGDPESVEVVEFMEQNECGRENKRQHNKPTFRNFHLLREAVALVTPATEMGTLSHGIPVSNAMLNNVLDAFVTIVGAKDDFLLSSSMASRVKLQRNFFLKRQPLIFTIRFRVQS